MGVIFPDVSYSKIFLSLFLYRKLVTSRSTCFVGRIIFFITLFGVIQHVHSFYNPYTIHINKLMIMDHIILQSILWGLSFCYSDLSLASVSFCIVKSYLMIMDLLHWQAFYYCSQATNVIFLLTLRHTHNEDSHSSQYPVFHLSSDDLLHFIHLTYMSFS